MLPTSRPAHAAQKRDEAPLAPSEPQQEPEPDRAAKPAFTRGPSVFDQTAVTSAAPTPAGEISNPMSFGMGQSVSRQRESHQPDLDLLLKVRAMSTVNKVREPDQVPSGKDEVRADSSRQET